MKQDQYENLKVHLNKSTRIYRTCLLALALAFSTAVMIWLARQWGQ